MARPKPKRDPLASKLDQLAAVRSDPTSPESLKRLRAALADHALVVAAAADHARDSEITELRDPLAAALARLFEAPAERDQGCRAKLALTQALVRCGHRDSDLFLRGVRHVQEEPVWGRKEDTAAGLRAAAAMGLAHLDDPQALAEIAALLADPQNVARAGAAQAAAYLGDRAGVPLLRFKALTGDADPQVMGEVFTALLRLDPRGSFDFVVRFLNNDDEAIADAAALALGESRIEAALDPLKAWSATLRHAAVGLLAIALLRSDRAFEHLLSLVDDAEPRTAARPVEVLATYRHDSDLRRRVIERVTKRNHPTLTQTLETKLGD
jgi:HEAT repeat protein